MGCLRPSIDRPRSRSTRSGIGERVGRSSDTTPRFCVNRVLTADRCPSKYEVARRTCPCLPNMHSTNSAVSTPPPPPPSLPCDGAHAVQLAGRRLPRRGGWRSSSVAAWAAGSPPSSSRPSRTGSSSSDVSRRAGSTSTPPGARRLRRARCRPTLSRIVVGDGPERGDSRTSSVACSRARRSAVPAGARVRRNGRPAVGGRPARCGDPSRQLWNAIAASTRSLAPVRVSDGRFRRRRRWAAPVADLQPGTHVVPAEAYSALEGTDERLRAVATLQQRRACSSRDVAAPASSRCCASATACCTPSSRRRRCRSS